MNRIMMIKNGRNQRQSIKLQFSYLRLSTIVIMSDYMRCVTKSSTDDVI